MITVKHRLLAAACSLGLALSPLAAPAQEHFTHHVFHDRVVAHFPPRELDIWRGGHWVHEWRNGRFGWWWFAGGVWYFYDTPVYPYPAAVSEVTVVEPMTAPPPPAAGGAPSYYYCDNPAGYYPYVTTCSVPFRPVPVAPPPAAAAPPPPPAR